MFLHIKKTTWTIGKFYKIIIICYDNIFRKWNKTSADRLVCCSKDSPASQTYFAREPILMMSGRGLPRGRRTKTKTIAALRLCLFLIFLCSVFLLILNIYWYWFYLLSSTFVLWLPWQFLIFSCHLKKARMSEGSCVLYLTCVDCCLISSYHLNKAQVSEAACTLTLYFKYFDCFWFYVMNHLE